MGTNASRREFINKYKVEGTKILEYPKEIDRFFTHKFENMQGALNGIIFYTNHDIHRKSALSNTYNIKTEEKIKNLKEETLKNYVHFIRFTETLNNPNIIEDCENIKNGIKGYKKIDLPELQERVQRRVDELIEKQKIQITKAGLYFTRQEEAYYKKSYANQTSLQEYDSAWWTEDLFSTVNYLRNLEKSDENNYYDTWIHCKIEREKNKENDTYENVQLLEEFYSRYKQNVCENKQKIENDKDYERI